MKLFFSGRSFKTEHTPPVIGRVKGFLDSTKKGELLDTNQLAATVKCDRSVLRGSNFYLVGYFHVWNNKKYWGNKATITQFKKEIQRNGNH